MKPNFIPVLLIPLKNNLKGIAFAIITFFDIILYRHGGSSPLLIFKRCTKTDSPSPPVSVLLLFERGHKPKFLKPTEITKAKDGPDQKTYWVEGHFKSPYNLTETLLDLLLIKYNLRRLEINERNCNLLSFAARLLMPDPVPEQDQAPHKNASRMMKRLPYPLTEQEELLRNIKRRKTNRPPYPRTQRAQSPLIKHFRKYYSRHDMDGVYRFHKFIRTQRTNVWQLWGDRKAPEELRQDILMSYNITPAAPVKKATKALLISRDTAYLRKGRNLIDRRILNEEELIAVLQKKLQSKGIQVRVARMGGLPMKEQLELINQTHILIGMHGAGLGHTLFLPQNAALLEMFPSHFATHYLYTFYMMAAGRRLHYARYIQLFPWQDDAGFTLKGWKKKYPGNYNLNKLIIPGDYSRIPPQKIYKRILTLAERVEACGRS